MKIFLSYAAANASAALGDASTLDSIDYSELMYMMKEGEMFDEHLLKSPSKEHLRDRESRGGGGGQRRR